jgi:hypothetical protein
MDIVFNTIEIKFKIEIINNEILKTKWEHFFKKRLNIIGSAQQCGTQVVNRVAAFFSFFLMSYLIGKFIYFRKWQPI